MFIDENPGCKRVNPPPSTGICHNHRQFPSDVHHQLGTGKPWKTPVIKRRPSTKVPSLMVKLLLRAKISAASSSFGLGLSAMKPGTKAMKNGGGTLRQAPFYGRDFPSLLGEKCRSPKAEAFKKIRS